MRYELREKISGRISHCGWLIARKWQNPEVELIILYKGSKSRYTERNEQIFREILILLQKHYSMAFIPKSHKGLGLRATHSRPVLINKGGEQRKNKLKLGKANI